MKKILLLILVLTSYSQTVLCQDESNNVGAKSILLELEKESDANTLNREMMNESVPDLLETSGVFENLPKDKNYLTREESINGTIDLVELNKEIKQKNQNDTFFEILTFVIASLILFFIGRLALKK